MTHDYDKWYNLKFRDKCLKHDVEAVINGDNTLVFICAHTPEIGIQKELLEQVPETQKHEFVERLKLVTVATISFTVSHLPGLKLTPPPMFEPSKRNPRHLILSVSGDIEVEDPMWTSIRTALEKDNFVESYEIHLNGHSFVDWNRKIVAEIAGRVKSENTISSDDLVNLKISLETCTSVDDFINQV